MSDTLIVIVIIAAAVIGGTLYIIRHMQGKGGGCCGGSASPSATHKKLSNPVIAQKLVKIDGMHCNHCKNAVESAIAHIDGAIAHVDLDLKQARIDLDRDVSNDVIQAAITDAGFTVVAIEDSHESH